MNFQFSFLKSVNRFGRWNNDGINSVIINIDNVVIIVTTVAL